MDLEDSTLRRSFVARHKQKALGAIAVVLLTALFTQLLRPPLLIVGNLTIDVVDNKKVLGGAISYAAAVATAYGVKACIVTAAAGDADWSAFEGHELHVVPTDHTLTFEHTYTWWGNHRKLRVLAKPNITLTMEHVPAHCRRARTVLLGPLTPSDLDAAAFVNHPQDWWDRLLGFKQHVGYMAQGEQRALDSSGRVSAVKAPSEHILVSYCQLA
jgi:formaldehyde-activating enzyme involved in methanogenesis